ncbi:hypothetical protein RhiirA4_550934 [Rhizophagus irregularis]|uniref:Uncharacterized protein n=1 Tax=Rhizophagus irregularis TaxID=588596 RepID=A0A2I1HR76_9GLOM|nr:hypothetical protein RhiirA4_550934 [Rhizophagus irregularis]
MKLFGPLVFLLITFNPVISQKIMALRQETFLRTAAIKPKSTVVPLINICPKGVTCCDDGHTCEGDYPVCCHGCIPANATCCNDAYGGYCNKDYPVCCQDGCIPANTTCCNNGGYCEKNTYCCNNNECCTNTFKNKRL